MANVRRDRWGLFCALLLVVATLFIASCSGPSSQPSNAQEAEASAAPAVSPTGTPAETTDTNVSPEISTSPSNTATSELGADATSRPPPTATEDPTATLAPTATAAPFPDQVAALLGDPAGFYGVVVEALDGSFSYRLNPDEQVESASLYKLPIMVELFRQREAGEVNFSSSVYLDPAYFHEAEGDVYDTSYIGAEVTVDELMENMITLSSNVAAYALLDLAGMPNINATMSDIGLVSTEIRWEPAPLTAATHGSFSYEQATERADNALNVTTAGDMALLFKMLAQGELISPEASQEMLDLLARQGINDRLPALLPEGTIVAHKTGNLPGEVIHDVGLIEAPATPVAIAVVTEGADEGVAVGFMQQLALLAYQAAS